MSHSASALLNRLLAKGKFRHIQVILNLVELGSVQKTAQSIGMSQSAVTQTLASLESLIEAPLFDRYARGVKPTALCNDLLPAIRQLMGGLSESAEMVVARGHLGLGTVRLMASAAAINGLLLEALAVFARIYPGFTVIMREAERPEQLRAIAESSVDLVVCREQTVVPEGWHFEKLITDRLVIACHQLHPLAFRRAITSLDLIDQTWIVTPAGTATRSYFDEFVSILGYSPNIHPIVTRSLSIICSLLRESSVLTLLPTAVIGAGLDAGEFIALDIPIESDLPPPIGMLTPQRGLEAATKNLCAYLRNYSNIGLIK